MLGYARQRAGPIPISDATIRRDLALVFRKDKALSRAALAFIDIAVKIKGLNAQAAGKRQSEQADPSVLLCHPERNRIDRAASDSVESKDPASARCMMNSQGMSPTQ
jgi:hypothetical protein